MIDKTFDDIFVKHIYINKKKIKIINDIDIILSKLGPLYEINNYFGLEDIMFKDGKGLIASKYDDILSLDQIKKYLINIFDKPSEITHFTENTINSISKLLSIDSIFEVNKYGLINKNFINENLYKFKFNSIENYDKPRIIHYYLRFNNWNLIYYDTADDAPNNTIKYALQAVGCIHTVKFNGKNKAPEFTLLLNKDFKNKYGYYIDNCRVLENEIWVLLFWIIEITNLFSLIYNRYDLNKTIYLNIHDHPIVKYNNDIINDDPDKHPFPNINKHLKNGDKLLIPVTVLPDENIYSWSSKIFYKDIVLPFPDFSMFLFGYDFSKNFHINNYYTISNSKKLIEKKTKAIFRGSYTNCSYPVKDSVRMISHIKTLQDSSPFDNGYIDSYIVGNSNSFNYQHFDNSYMEVTNIDDYSIDKKFMPETDQINYRYILNLDGFASAFRIIKEMYYNSILIIPKSEFTDVIRQILVPWKHYIPCNKDLSNLKTTITWCNLNLPKMQIILNNLKELRDAVISPKNMLELTYQKIINGNNNYNFIDISKFNISSQNTIDYSDFIDTIDIETKLNKSGHVTIKNFKGEELYKEDIHYKKYIKYKNKYSNLKLELNQK